MLRKRCREVVWADDRIRALLGDMTDTMHATGEPVCITGERNLAKCLYQEMDYPDGIVFKPHN